VTDLLTLSNVLQLPSFAFTGRNVHQRYVRFQPLARTREATVAERGISPHGLGFGVSRCAR
jgi:hypothetical protein